MLPRAVGGTGKNRDGKHLWSHPKYSIFILPYNPPRNLRKQDYNYSHFTDEGNEVWIRQFT